MIWSWVFYLIFSILGGGTLFLVPKLDNYVKTHIVDDSRKETVLDLLKDAKKKRNEVFKKNSKNSKELKKLSMSRETTQADFDQLWDAILEVQTESLQTNIMVTRKAQENITSEEWAAIEVDIAKSYEKYKRKKMIKHAAKMEKTFLKWESLISKTIADEKKRKQAVASVDKLKKVSMGNSRIILDEYINDKSIMYQYKTSETEMIALQDDFVNLIKEVYQTYVSTHFELVKSSTPKEWKKIK